MYNYITIIQSLPKNLNFHQAIKNQIQQHSSGIIWNQGVSGFQAEKRLQTPSGVLEHTSSKKNT